MDDAGFRYDDGRVTIRYGRGAAASLGAEVDRLGTRAFVVTGETVGETAGVMEPLCAGLGDRLAGVYANAGTDLRVSRACEAARQARAAGADVLVSVGSGSAVALARSARIVHARELTAAEAAAEVAERGTLRVPAQPTPTVSVPTTLAGAAISKGAGVTAETDGEVTSAVVADWALVPQTVVFDPAVFEPTPPAVLAASAMNGFDKGIETIYAATGSPITHATARDGLRYFLAGLEALPATDRDPATLDRAVLGGAMVRFGTVGPETHTLSVIHAFGHALLAACDVHLGRAHAALAPSVLRAVFDRTDGQRGALADALAPALGREDTRDRRTDTDTDTRDRRTDTDTDTHDAFGVGRGSGTVGWFDRRETGPTADGATGSSETDAERVVRAVETVRATLELPTRLRDLSDPPARSELPRIADSVVGDPFLEHAPPGVDLTREAAERVLRDAY